MQSGQPLHNGRETDTTLEERLLPTDAPEGHPRHGSPHPPDDRGAARGDDRERMKDSAR